MTRAQANLLLILAALIWGVAYYFQKSAMTHIGPLLFLGLRAAVAAAALAPFVAVERRPSKSAPGSVLPVAIMGGLIFFVAAALQQFGLVTATITNAGFLTALYVVATPFIVWIFRRRSPAASVWVGVALASAGTWALSGGSVAEFSGGDWLIATSSLAWATHIVVTGEAARHARPLTYTCVQFTAVALLALSLAVIFEPISLTSVADAAGAVLYAGLLSSALTFAILAVAMRHVSAPRAAILVSLDTIFAAAAGYFLLGERLSPFGWAGAGLMFAAVLVVQLGRRASDKA